MVIRIKEPTRRSEFGAFSFVRTSYRPFGLAEEAVLG
jgi:hypothetical protein